MLFWNRTENIVIKVITDLEEVIIQHLLLVTIDMANIRYFVMAFGYLNVAELVES